MSSTELSGPTLKQYRMQRGVSQEELARELGRGFASYVCRLEKRPEVGRVLFAETVAAIERVAEQKRKSVDPMKILRASDDAA